MTLHQLKKQLAAAKRVTNAAMKRARNAKDSTYSLLASLDLGTAILKEHAARKSVFEFMRKEAWTMSRSSNTHHYLERSPRIERRKLAKRRANRKAIVTEKGMK